MPSGSRCAAVAAAFRWGAMPGEGFRCRSWLQRLVPDRFPGHAGANAVDAAVPIKQIVGVEWNDLALRRDEMNAGTLDVADTEIEAVEELHNGDAEHVLVAEIGRRLEGRQATQEFGEALAGVEWPRRQRKQLNELFTQHRVFF